MKLNLDQRPRGHWEQYYLCHYPPLRPGHEKSKIYDFLERRQLFGICPAYAGLLLIIYQCFDDDGPPSLNDSLVSK